jgi:hypothetical protein
VSLGGLNRVWAAEFLFPGCHLPIKFLPIDIEVDSRALQPTSVTVRLTVIGECHLVGPESYSALNEWWATTGIAANSNPATAIRTPCAALIG